MESEGKQWQTAQELVAFQVEVEHGMFTFPQKPSGQEIRAAACAHIPDVTRMDVSLLDQNHRSTQLKGD